MALDIDDPATWPEDAEALAKLADGLPEEPTGEAEAPTETAETPESTPERDAQGRFAKTETEAEPPPEESAEAPILTADGKHYIPHSVLKETRERAQQAEAQLRAYQEHVAALQQQAQYQPPLQAVAPPVEDPLQTLWNTPVALSEAEMARVEQVRKDWGDDQAETLQQSYLALKRTELQDQILRAQHQAFAQQQQQMEALQAQLAQRQQQESQVETTQIQAAIDQSPLLAAWQADNASPYFDHSVKLHEFLMNSDPTYQQLGWNERMSLLPAKVEALYGASPHAAQVGAVAPAKPSGIPATKPKKTPDVPLSHSDIRAGGSPPEASEIERLDQMSPAQLQQHLSQMSAKDLQAYLMQVG